MTTSTIGEVVRHLHRTLAHGGAAETDGALLERFVRDRDDDAIAALVRRHAAMVWGVCRRTLHGYQDAEDAFQATFLVLVRRAASVKPREMVASWLYGVAHRTALNARAAAARRNARERQERSMPEPAVASPDPGNDLRQLLDQELRRLPDKYRAAIVLCDLEGQTRKDAARQFGVPEGTLSGWLTRGRALLGKRLTRRGITLPAATAAAVLVPELAPASVLAELVARMVRATAGAADLVPATGRVPLLMERVVNALRLSKVRRLSVRAAAFGLLAACVGLFVVNGFAQPGGKEPPAARPAAAAKADEPKSRPSYCWLVFGPGAKLRTLVRLDGEELAIDRNGDGKFTGKGERFKTIADFKDVTITAPGGKASYTITGVADMKIIPPEKFLSFRVHNRGSLDYYQECIIQLADGLRGAPEAHFDGPLAISPNERRIVNLATDLAKNDLVDLSPLVPEWLNQLVGKGIVTNYRQAKSLKRGNQPTELCAHLAMPGDNSFVAVCSPDESDQGRREKSPFPAGVVPVVDVEFPPAKAGGPPLKRRYSLDRHLCDSLYVGPVPVPAEAGAGIAKITFSLDNWKGFKVAPYVLELPIEDPPAKGKDAKK